MGSERGIGPDFNDASVVCIEFEVEASLQISITAVVLTLLNRELIAVLILFPAPFLMSGYE